MLCGTFHLDESALARSDDQELLTEGMTLFDALYHAFTQAARSSGPRPIAKPNVTKGSRRRAK